MKKLMVFIFFKVPLTFVLLSVLAVAVLKWVPVLVTPIMVSRSIEHRGDRTWHTEKKWVRLEKISPELVKAVIASEDNLFFEHNGFDVKAMKAAAEYNRKGKRIRGGSTISQQTAKNLFTLHKRTMWRKGVEVWFTFLIEKIWDKERILEVYLNVAEMGDGVYGAQAAAQHWFAKDASELDRTEACRIAVSLPNPRKSNPAKPSDYLRKQSARIYKRIPTLKWPEWLE